MTEKGIKGTAKYKGYDASFSCNGRTLFLVFSQSDYNELMHAVFLNADTAKPRISLEEREPIVGYRASDGKMIVFFPSFRGTVGRSFPQLSIAVPITGYCATPVDAPVDSGVTLRFESTQMHRFLGMASIFRTKKNSNNTISFVRTQDVSWCSLRAVFSVDGKQISIAPGIGKNHQLLPSLNLRVEESFDLPELFAYAQTLISTLHFVFFRKDFYPDAIKIQFDGLDEEGEIVIGHPPVDTESDSFDYGLRDAMPWNIVYRHFGNIFLSAWKGTLFYDYIPEDLMGRIAVTFTSTYKDAASFESAFGMKKTILIARESEREEELNETALALDEAIEANSEKRPKAVKKLKQWRKGLYNPSFREKLYSTFIHYEQCLETLKRIVANEEKYNHIAQACRDLRNQIDHGDPKRKTDPKIAAAFCLLRAATLCLQLDTLGFSQSEIKDSIDSLFRIRELGFEKTEPF